jgi:hypothetical protein
MADGFVAGKAQGAVDIFGRTDEAFFCGCVQAGSGGNGLIEWNEARFWVRFSISSVPEPVLRQPEASLKSGDCPALLWDGGSNAFQALRDSFVKAGLIQVVARLQAYPHFGRAVKKPGNFETQGSRKRRFFGKNLVQGLVGFAQRQSGVGDGNSGLWKDSFTENSAGMDRRIQLLSQGSTPLEKFQFRPRCRSAGKSKSTTNVTAAKEFESKDRLCVLELCGADEPSEFPGNVYTAQFIGDF